MALIFFLVNIFIILIRAQTTTIWNEPMDDSNGQSNWVTTGTITTQTQAVGCPSLDGNTNPTDCWSLCSNGDTMTRSTNTTNYMDISLTFSIDPWAMTSANQDCDIEWSNDGGANWNLIHTSTNDDHIIDQVVYLSNATWDQPNIDIRVFVNSASSSSCCYVSNFILNGTMIISTTAATFTSTQMYTTAATATPIIPVNGTNFFIDDDWILTEPYPFPVNACIHSSADFLGVTDELWSYYECNADGTQITKYRWNDIAETDCMNKSSADSVNYYSAPSTNAETCDLHYFECNGQDNYMTANFYIAFSGCDESPTFFLSLSVATGVCYCDSLTTSLELTCDPSNAWLSNYTGGYNQCINNNLAAQQSLGVSGQPTLFQTVQNVPICIEMIECVADSVNSVTTKDPSAAPTETRLYFPTASTTTPPDGEVTSNIPTSPTDDNDESGSNTSDGGLMDYIILIIIGVLLLICCLCLVLYYKQKRKRDRLNNMDDVINNKTPAAAATTTSNKQKKDQQNIEMIFAEGSPDPSNNVGGTRTAGAPSMVPVDSVSNKRMLSVERDKIMEDIVDVMSNAPIGFITPGGPPIVNNNQAGDNDYEQLPREQDDSDAASSQGDNDDNGYAPPNEGDKKQTGGGVNDNKAFVTPGGDDDDNGPVPPAPIPPDDDQNDDDLILPINGMVTTRGGGDSDDDDNAPPAPAPPI